MSDQYGALAAKFEAELAKMQQARDEARASLARVTEELALREQVIEDLNAGRLELKAECARLREEGAVLRAVLLAVADDSGNTPWSREQARNALRPSHAPVPDIARVQESLARVDADMSKLDALIGFKDKPAAPSPKEDAPRCEACAGKGWAWLHPVPAGGGNLKAGDCPDCGGTGRSPDTTPTKEK